MSKKTNHQNIYDSIKHAINELINKIQTSQEINEKYKKQTINLKNKIQQLENRNNQNEYKININDLLVYDYTMSINQFYQDFLEDINEISKFISSDATQEALERVDLLVTNASLLRTRLEYAHQTLEIEQAKEKLQKIATILEITIEDSCAQYTAKTNIFSPPTNENNKNLTRSKTRENHTENSADKGINTNSDPQSENKHKNPKHFNQKIIH